MAEQEDERIRASDAERDAAMERLRDAAGEGRLSLEELADRVEAAGGASTRGELATLIADLPQAPAPLPHLPAGQEVAPVGSSSVFGDVRRSGRWTVPAQSHWSTVFGDVVLDLRDAQVEGTELTVGASTVFGDVQLLVPEGVVVEVRSRVVFGDVRQDAGMLAPAGAPRIVLTGGTLFGDVRVRAQRLRERLGLVRRTP